MPKAWPNLNLDQLVENDKLAERGRGWAECVPSLFFERWDKWNSPYINHFLSADTIVPNPYTSQSWNRYAYVNNNPINAIDPTGHQCVGEPEECLEDDGTTGSGFPGGGGSPGAGNCSGSGCQGNDDHDPGSTDGGASCDTNGNGIPDIPCPGLTTRDWNDGFNRLGSPDICPVTSLIECYYLHASLDMGQIPMNIDLNEFRALLLAIYYEVNGRDSGDLILSSMSFDTPFYDHGVLGGGALPGTACIDGLGCFARHELNYVAQGEISAAAGESPFAGQFRVQEWKLVFGLGSKASSGTITMWNIGYVFYNSQSVDHEITRKGPKIGCGRTARTLFSGICWAFVHLS